VQLHHLPACLLLLLLLLLLMYTLLNVFVSAVEYDLSLLLKNGRTQGFEQVLPSGFRSNADSAKSQTKGPEIHCKLDDAHDHPVQCLRSVHVHG
jgi:hypothetical protein